MIQIPLHIKKASGESGSDGSGSEMSQYAFKTLWIEATKAVEHVVNGIATIGMNRSNNSSAVSQYYWIHSGDSEDERNSNYGFYIILTLVVIIGTTMFIIKKKKKK